MRHVLILTAVIISAGFGLAFWLEGADAAPLSGISPAVGPAGVVEEVGYWRRYCKFNDCTGSDDVDIDVTVPGETPPVMAIVPVRPVSCGQYRYWAASDASTRVTTTPISGRDRIVGTRSQRARAATRRE